MLALLHIRLSLLRSHLPKIMAAEVIASPRTAVDEVDIDRGRLSLSPSPPPFELRKYQKEGIKRCLDALKSGQRRIGLSAPTGAGKTAIIASLIPDLPEVARYWSRSTRPKVLIIVPTRELVVQVVDTIKGMYDDCGYVGIEQGCVRASTADSIIVATWQTLMQEERLSRFDPQLFKAVISDEAHGDAADRLLGILHYFNDDVDPPPKTKLFAKKRKHGHKVPIIGLSATFARTDKRQLGWVFEEIVYRWTWKSYCSRAKPLADLVSLCRAQWLPLWPEVQKLKAPTSDDQNANADEAEISDEVVVKKELEMFTGEIRDPDQADDFDHVSPTKSMLKAAKTPHFVAFVVGAYLRHASARKATLIFCADLKAVNDLVARLHARGIQADSVSSKTPENDRVRISEAFRTGQCPVLVNCFILAEGIDIPKIDAIFIAKPVRSKNMWSQMIGRGLRASPQTGKTECLVSSFFDGWGRLSLGVVPRLH